MVELVSKGAVPEQHQVGPGSRGMVGQHWPGLGGQAPSGSRGGRKREPRHAGSVLAAMLFGRDAGAGMQLLARSFHGNSSAGCCSLTAVGDAEIALPIDPAPSSPRLAEV